MLNKRGMFLIDALMALMVICIVSAILITALSMVLKAKQVEKEEIHVEEIFEAATRLHDD